MSQIIMWFLFPIGLYSYFFVERRDWPNYQNIFDTFGAKVKSDTTKTNKQKIDMYIAMLAKNGYTITESTPLKVKGEKRLLSISMLAMGLGLFYVGAIVYIAYYFWIQKPHVVVYQV